MISSFKNKQNEPFPRKPRGRRTCLLVRTFYWLWRTSLLRRRRLVAGIPWVKAPHIAALANRSPVLGKAYTNFPLCAPSRASLLTGRYASSIPVWDNADELPASAPTIAHFLRGRRAAQSPDWHQHARRHRFRSVHSHPANRLRRRGEIHRVATHSVLRFQKQIPMLKRGGLDVCCSF